MRDISQRVMKVEFARTITVTYYRDVIVGVPADASTQEVQELMEAQVDSDPLCDYLCDIDGPCISDDIWSDEDEDGGWTIVEVTDRGQAITVAPEVTLTRCEDGSLLLDGSYELDEGDDEDDDEDDE